MKLDPMMSNMVVDLCRTQPNGYTGFPRPPYRNCQKALELHLHPLHVPCKDREQISSLLPGDLTSLFPWVMKSSVRYITLKSIKQVSIKFRRFFFFALKGNRVVNWSTIKQKCHKKNPEILYQAQFLFAFYSVLETCHIKT